VRRDDAARCRAGLFPPLGPINAPPHPRPRRRHRTGIASLSWSITTGTPFAPLAWWDATQWWLANWWVNLCLAASAVIATAAIAILLFALYQIRRWHIGTSQRRLSVRPRLGAVRASERGITDNHGHSQWRSISDAKKLFSGPHPVHGGIVVGEAYRVDHDQSVAGIAFDPADKRTWGMGGTAPLLIDPCTHGSGHSLIFAGPGGFKTTSAVSTILAWRGSSVVLDPSTELGPMFDAALRRQRKDVVHIGIPNEDATRPPVTGFNVLRWIDTTHAEAELHVRSVVSWIYDDDAAAHATRPGRAEDPFFAAMGRNLVTSLLAHIVWSDPHAVDISLRELAKAIARPEDEMLDLLAHIRGSSHSRMAQRIAATLKCKAEETFSGVFLNAVKGVEWLFTTAYAELVSAGDFDPHALLIGKTTVFLNISLRTLETTPPLARVLVGALLNTVYMADGWTQGRVLFLLDEAARLGRMKTLETARDIGRKYGVTLHMLYQSVGQMAEAWGREGTRAWIDAAAWVGYAAIRAGGAGKDLADQLGAHGVLAWSEGDNQGRQKPFGLNFGSISRGINVNVHEIRRSLITAAEMQQDLREDEIIIVPASGLPLRIGRAIYFRRPEMIAQVANSRFAHSATPGVMDNGRSGVEGTRRAAPREGREGAAVDGILATGDQRRTHATPGPTADDGRRETATDAPAPAPDAMIVAGRSEDPKPADTQPIDSAHLAGRSPAAISILDLINAGTADGRRFTNVPPPPPDRAAWRLVQRHIPTLSDQQAYTVIRTWLQNGRLVQRTYHDPINRRDTQGLYVEPPSPLLL
jgi:type IV secretion system protein VirD4